MTQIITQLKKRKEIKNKAKGKIEPVQVKRFQLPLPIQFYIFLRISEL